MYEIEQYYNNEAGQYSHKRYEGVTDSYVKYFFKRRLSLVLIQLANLGGSILEIGTADGVVLRAIHRYLPNRFVRLVGVDIAANMVAQAKERSVGMPIEYTLVVETPAAKFDVVMAVGFMNGALWQKEKTYIRDHLQLHGHCLVSVAGRNSLHVRFKLKGATYLDQFWSYKRFEISLKDDFEIVDKRRYGFFVPKLWAIPVLGRVLQPIFDRVFQYLAPELFHETLYLLRAKK